MLRDLAINTNLFVVCSISKAEESFKQETFLEKTLMPKSKRSVICQTMYRESSAQTDPWLPDAKLRTGEKFSPEILMVSCDTEPGLREVEAIDRARIRLEWERALPKLSKTELPLRIAQLEAFEWEEIVAREREMNENQKDRMEQVTKMIEERYERNKMFSEAMIESVKQRNDIEVKRKKSKLEISYQRRLRQLQKVKNGSSDTDDYQEPTTESSVPLIDMLKTSKDVQILFKYPDPKTSSVDMRKVLSSRKKLCEPKGTVKEASHGARSEHNLKSLCNSLKTPGSKRDLLRCRTQRHVEKKIEDALELGDDEKNDDSYQNQLMIQKTVKGASIKKTLVDGIADSSDQIQKNRQKFPLSCLDTIPPQKMLETLSQTSDEIEESASEVKENPMDAIKSLVDDILRQTDYEIREMINKKLLQQAEKERGERRYQLRWQQMKQMRCDEIKRQIDEAHVKIAGEVLDKILPAVIKTIAENDARELIGRFAYIIDNEAWSSTETDEDIVAEVLRKILVPDIVKNVELQSKPDEKLVALLAAHDAFDIFLETFPINSAEIICGELFEDILNDFE